MSEPTPTAAPERTNRAGPLAAAMLVALLAVLGVSEGNSHRSYWDAIAKVWTICRGVTGPDIVEGLVWTDEQCVARESQMLQDFNTRVMRCLGGAELTSYEHFAFLHFAWNVGPDLFCRSSVAESARHGDYARACARIEEAFFRAGGKDCRVAANRCRGVIVRRKFERAMCEGKLNLPGVWK